MAVAVEVKHTCAPQGEAGRGIPLGVELDQLQLIAGEVGQKRDVMVFLHGVVQGDEELVLHPLHGQLMMLVGILGFGDVQRRQGDAATAHHGLPGGVEHIAAERADVELAPQQVGCPIPVDDGFSLHQLQHADPQSCSQRFQQGDIRQTLGGLPLGNGLGADREHSGKLCLGQALGFPQLPDGAACDVCVHVLSA